MVDVLEVRSSDTSQRETGRFLGNFPRASDIGVVLHLESPCEAGRDPRSQGERRGQCGGNGPFMPCCLGKNCHFTFQLGGTLGSIISATRGKWARPSAGPLQLLLMSLLSDLPTFLYAN